MTRREVLKLCGKSFCLFTVSSLSSLPQTSQAQGMQKGLIRTKLSPYFAPLKEGTSGASSVPIDAGSPGGREDSAG